MFDKFTLQNLYKSGGVQNSLLYITSDVNSMYYEALFFNIQTSDRMQRLFTILQDKLQSFNIQNDRSTHNKLSN